MKSHLILLIVHIASFATLGQGRFDFQAALEPTPASPPETYTSRTVGYFTLTGDIFQGSATFLSDTGPGLAILQDASGRILSSIECRLVPDQDLTPDWVFSNATWPNITLTPSERADLFAGNLTVTIETSDFYDRFIQGPIRLVPEPKFSALAAFGIALLALRKRQPIGKTCITED